MDALKDLLPVAREVAEHLEAGELDPETVVRVEVRWTEPKGCECDACAERPETFVEWSTLPDPLDPMLKRVYSFPASMLAHIARIHADKAAAAQTEA